MPPTNGYRVPRLSVQDIANNLYKAVFDSWQADLPDRYSIYSAIKWGVFAAFSNPEDVSNSIQREDILEAIQSGTREAFGAYLREARPSPELLVELRPKPIAVFDDDPDDELNWNITTGKFKEE